MVGWAVFCRLSNSELGKNNVAPPVHLHTGLATELLPAQIRVVGRVDVVPGIAVKSFIKIFKFYKISMLTTKDVLAQRLIHVLVEVKPIHENRGVVVRHHVPNQSFLNARHHVLNQSFLKV